MKESNRDIKRGSQTNNSQDPDRKSTNSIAKLVCKIKYCIFNRIVKNHGNIVEKLVMNSLI